MRFLNFSAKKTTVLCFYHCMNMYCTTASIYLTYEYKTKSTSLVYRYIDQMLMARAHALVGVYLWFLAAEERHWTDCLCQHSIA